MPTGIVVFRGKAPVDLGSELAVVRVVAGTRSFRALGKSAQRRIHMLLDRLRAWSKENDERVCLCVCVCLSVRDHIIVRSSPNFLCMLPMAVARSSSGGVVI